MYASFFDFGDRQAKTLSPDSYVHLGGFGQHPPRHLNARMPRCQPSDDMSRGLYKWPLFMLVKFHVPSLKAQSNPLPFRSRLRAFFAFCFLGLEGRTLLSVLPKRI